MRRSLLLNRTAIVIRPGSQKHQGRPSSFRENMPPYLFNIGCSDLQHVTWTFRLFGLELGIYYSWCVASLLSVLTEKDGFWEKQTGWLESVVAGLLRLNVLQWRTCQHTGMQRRTAAKQLHQQSRPSKHPPIGWRGGGRGRTCFLRRDWSGFLSKAVSLQPRTCEAEEHNILKLFLKERGLV